MVFTQGLNLWFFHQKAVPIGVLTSSKRGEGSQIVLDSFWWGTVG